MRATKDQALAQRLLSMRDQGAYSFGRFLKLNVWRYLFQIALHSMLLAILAFLGMWPPFIFLLGLVLGGFLRDLGWVRSSGRVWPFTVKVTNWDLVEKIATLKPQTDESVLDG
jgi:hypothetical protein